MGGTERRLYHAQPLSKKKEPWALLPLALLRSNTVTPQIHTAHSILFCSQHLEPVKQSLGKPNLLTSERLSVEKKGCLCLPGEILGTFRGTLELWPQMFNFLSFLQLFLIIGLSTYNFKKKFF